VPAETSHAAGRGAEGGDPPLEEGGDADSCLRMPAWGALARGEGEALSEHFNRVDQLPKNCQDAYRRLRDPGDNPAQIERDAWTLVQEIFRLMERDYLASWERNPDRMGQ
jgi:hypothetical protein